MKRREFLTTGTVGLVAALLPPNVAFAAPCPPPDLQLEGDSVATACGASTQATFRLTSAVGGTLLPFTIGFPFKRGDVPSGKYISSGLADFQADVRNRWSDGSVKFAVLSGRQTLGSGSSATVTLTTASTAPGGSNVPEPTPAFLGTNVSVTLTGAGAGTYTPQTAANNGITTWNRTSARKVREMLGPVMSEFHYYSPTSDGHLTIWWYLRVYSDRTEVETAIEQGWIKVPSVADKTYTATITIAGVVRATQTNLNHRHHTRWSRRDWIGTDPQITPQHSSEYIKSTKLVPNYAVVTVGETSANDGLGLSNYVQAAAPMTKGNFEFNGSGTGSHQFLGILPEWEAAYVISGDARAFRATLANEQASNCWHYGGAAGSQWGFGIISRDENTGLPIATLDYSTESFAGGAPGSGGIALGPTGTQVFSTDLGHSWNAGYLAYLLTGRWYSLELVQFNHGTNHLGVSSSSGTNRLTNANGGGDRGVAWFARTMAACLAITPDNHPLQAKMITYVQNNIAAWKSAEVGFNKLGVRKNTYDNMSPNWTISFFMQYFISQSFAWGREVAADSLSAAAQTNWLDVAQFHCGFPTGLLGGRPGGHCFKYAAKYEGTIGPSIGTYYASFDEMFNAQSYAGDACAIGSPLVDSYYIFSSYWGNFHPAAAYACDLQGLPGTYSALVSGAIAGWNRMIGASNWPKFANDMGHAPQWAINPRVSV